MYVSGSQVLDGDKGGMAVVLSIDMKGWERFERNPRLKSWLETKGWAKDGISKISFGRTIKISPTQMAEHKGSLKRKSQILFKKKKLFDNRFGGEIGNN